MPYEVVETDGRYCVHKEGNAKPIEGGCHDTRQAAEDHMSALYANEANVKGARHSRADQEAIQMAHDACVKAGATCQSANSEMPEPKTEQPKTLDTLVFYGDAIKALGNGRVGGYLVRFSDPDNPGDRDLTSQYFRSDSYYGPNDGDGADTYFHHAIPVRAELAYLADRTFAPLKIARDKIGLFAETVLNMADEYEKMIYDLAEQGKLGWSSGAPGHLVRIAPDGAILRWPIAEGSLTPTPAEPRNRALTLKSLAAAELAADPGPVIIFPLGVRND